MEQEKTICISLSPDKLYAYITLTKPQLNETYTVEGILQALEQDGINYGINHEIVEKIVKDSIYDKKIKIAVGRQPVDGSDSMQYSI